MVDRPGSEGRVLRQILTDAATYLRWVQEFGPIVEQILVPEAQSPPLEPGLRRTLLERSALDIEDGLPNMARGDLPD